MGDIFSLLIVDDERFIQSSMKRLLLREPYRILTASSGREALQVLAESPVDLVLLDLRMPGMDGFEVLEKMGAMDLTAKVVIFTADGGVEEAVLGMQMGAVDFLEKSYAPELVRHRIAKQYQLWQLEQENRDLKAELHPTFSFDQMIGDSPSMTRLKELIVRVAPTDTTVLIQGESGTGKELVAKALHHHSRRAGRPFVVIDCAAISETVFESELFGHERGAFTGADRRKTGLIRSAEGGTLFFDELGELPLKMQAKLLRTLQERTVRPVGSEDSFTLDVRVLAATNRNLMEEVRKGDFREDLYYRFSAVTLAVPPLRDRREDISALADHQMARHCAPGTSPPKLSKGALKLLQGHPWAGNVRELENALRGGMAFCLNNELTELDFPNLGDAQPQAAVGGDQELVTLQDYERHAIEKALAATGQNRRKAAQRLGIGEATLYRKIQQYGLVESE